MFRHCINRTRCQPSDPSTDSVPPSMSIPMTTEQRMWQKVKSQPLVPLGCMATVYFLVSGLKSFQRRDPVTSQRMMRNRVIAQFVTILCFIGYVGAGQADFRLAPMVQDKIAAEKLKQQQLLQEQEKQKSSTTAASE